MVALMGGDRRFTPMARRAFNLVVFPNLIYKPMKHNRHMHRSCKAETVGSRPTIGSI